MRYVVDSSVALKWALSEADSADAIRLRDDYHGGFHELVAPDFLPLEIAHALTRAERQRRIAQAAGWGFWQDIMADCPALVPSNPLTPRAFELSSKKRIGVYDCLYVALAERERSGVVTADQRLLNTFPTLTIALASLP